MPARRHPAEPHADPNPDANAYADANPDANPDPEPNADAQSDAATLRGDPYMSDPDPYANAQPHTHTVAITSAESLSYTHAHTSASSYPHPIAHTHADAACAAAWRRKAAVGSNVAPNVEPQRAHDVDAPSLAETGIDGRVIAAFIWFTLAGLLALFLGRVFALNKRGR